MSPGVPRVSAACSLIGSRSPIHHGLSCRLSFTEGKSKLCGNCALKRWALARASAMRPLAASALISSAARSSPSRSSRSVDSACAGGPTCLDSRCARMPRAPDRAAPVARRDPPSRCERPRRLASRCADLRHSRAVRVRRGRSELTGQRCSHRGRVLGDGALVWFGASQPSVVRRFA